MCFISVISHVTLFANVHSNTHTDVDLAKQRYGNERADMCLSLVEQDLNLIVYNAIIYNGKQHNANKAALRFRETFQKVMKETHWDACRFCAKCNGDEIYFENLINICDWCCAGVHTLCMDQPRPPQQGVHPLRGDDAWFCSNACRTCFEDLAKDFCLPDNKVVCLSLCLCPFSVSLVCVVRRCLDPMNLEKLDSKTGSAEQSLAPCVSRTQRVAQHQIFCADFRYLVFVLRGTNVPNFSGFPHIL